MSNKITNPFRPETTVTLVDGIERKFKWTCESQILSLEYMLAQPEEQLVVNESERKQRIRMALSVAKNMLMILFAGLAEDARSRNEKWTVERVAALMPTDTAELEELLKRLNPLIGQAQDGPGESGASVGASGRPTRNKGRSGRRR